MEREVTISLPAGVVGEILGFLRDGVEMLTDTIAYLEDGCVITPCTLANCSDADEARRWKRLYGEAIKHIEGVID